MTKYRSIYRTILLSALVAMLLGGAASPAFAASLTPLGDLPGGRFDSLATAVSADGSTIVGFSSSASDNEAFRWTAASGMVGLGGLKLGGSGVSYAAGVSADGSVVVGTGITAGDSGEAFRWTAASGMVGLGDLPGGDFYSQANAVSADGSTVVGYSRVPVSGHYDLEAFRWTAASDMVGLGRLPGGYSNAWDVSADGSTVVGEIFSDSGLEAVRWTSAGGMERLWDVLLANGVDPAADGWTLLLRASGVSANGNTIVGNGIRNGNLEAFVAVVPEPASFALLALGLPFLVGRNSRRLRTGLTRGAHGPMTVLLKL